MYITVNPGISNFPCRKKAELNKHGRHGFTPLHNAVLYLKKNCITLLVDAGAGKLLGPIHE